MDQDSSLSNLGTLQKFAEIAKTFEKACAWLESQSVKIEANRFHSYRETIEKIEAAEKSGSSSALLPELPALTQHLFDISVVNQIYKGLSSNGIAVPKIKLVEITKGPDLISAETERNNRPRNTSFELEVAAVFARNFPPVFESDKCPCDLLIEVGNKRVAIECKRPFGNIVSSAKDGFSQLRKRYSKSSDRGILAISCNVVTGLTNVYCEAKDEKELARESRRRAQEFFESVRKSLPPPNHDQTIAVVLHFRALGILANGNLWVDQMFMFAPNRDKSSPDRKIIKALSRSVDSFLPSE